MITFFGIICLLVALVFVFLYMWIGYPPVTFTIGLFIIGCIIMYIGDLSKKKSDKEDADHIKENKDKLLEKF